MCQKEIRQVENKKDAEFRDTITEDIYRFERILIVVSILDSTREKSGGKKKECEDTIQKKGILGRVTRYIEI